MNIKRVDIFVVRTMQFTALTFFTFAVFLWYGMVFLLPMALWINISAGFSGVFGDMIGTALGTVLMCAATYYVAKVSGLVYVFLGVGLDVCKIAAASMDRFNKVADAIKQDIEPEDSEIEIAVKSQAN